MRDGAIRIEKTPPEAYYCREQRAAHSEKIVSGEKRSEFAFHRSLSSLERGEK
jgi:hypothetical protein